MRRYTVLLTPEQDGSAYNVSVPLLPGCYTFGATVQEALERAREAIAVYAASMADDGESLPEERLPPQIAVVEVEEAAIV